MRKSAAVQAKKKQTLWFRIKREVSRNYVLYLLSLVPFAILIIFKYIPMYGIQIAFRDYKVVRGISGSKWVGLKYIYKFFNSPLAMTYIWNTLAISLYELLTFPLSLILALLLTYIPSNRFRKTVQMVSYAPHFISTVVMCGMITQFLDVRSGMINKVLEVFGIKARSWMTYTSAFRHIYVWSGEWQGLGYGSIIYIAALAGVSSELHEAAIVDGANILQRIWHVDIPSVLPTFCVLLILKCGSIMSVGFEKVLLLQNNLNKNVSEIISTYTYNIGLNSSGAMPQYSYGSAIGLFTSFVNMILLFIVNTITRKLSGSGLWK